MKKQSNDATKVLEKDTCSKSSEDEETDSMSDQTSSQSDGGQNNQTQFSVLRSDTNGLRMKISAIRNKKEIQSIDFKSRNSSENNNLEKAKDNLDKHKSKMLKSTGMLVVAGGSSCSLCSHSENDSSFKEAIKDKTRKVKLKRKKANKFSIPEQINVRPSNSSDSENEETNEKQNKIPEISLQNLVIKKPLNNLKHLSDPILPDNSCMSSSDNDLPALVNAAIKCVESDSEVENCLVDVPKNQYTSSLLQDFIEKTQQLGQNFSNNKKTPINKQVTSDTLHTLQSKKRRGRPKKSSDNLTVNNAVPNLLLAVNESADSGITSTTQSSSPSPKNSTGHRKNLVKVDRDISQPSAVSSTASKQKIDIVSLDKRMYATERVLYPPPRNKRRASSTAKQNAKLKLSKDDNALDPIWRKIDINTRFRRPSLSGYKSDGGNTICSKILAAKSGYVSDYGSVYARSHYSGYKSDASVKSRCSMRSCISRAKSCDFRSEGAIKSRKFRRKRSKSIMKHSKSVGNVNDQDILQLAGLSLGQSSEESNEYVCKPLLPHSQAAKKFGEINRFVTTGQYFGRSQSINNDDHLETSSILSEKLCFKSSRNHLGSEFTNDLMDRLPRKIRSRRSSVTSYCSSYYSGVSKFKKCKRRRSFRYGNRSCPIDSKLSTEIDIIVNSFSTLCRINGEKSSSSKEKDSKSEKERATQKVQSKRNQKKRKLSENADFLITSTSTSKRRHKKACSSSPDDHKLPLKKRHYLLTPGEKSTEGKATTNSTDNKKDVGDVKVINKNTSSSSGIKVSLKPAITPKKRHLLQTSQTEDDISINSHTKCGNSSPSQNDSKLLIKSMESSTGHKTTEVSRKRHRLEGLVSKISATTLEVPGCLTNVKEMTNLNTEKQCPPPGVFEPSVELEIQIPIPKLAESSIVTKSEVDSPLDLLDLNKSFSEPSKTERVVESLLNKTGANLILKRKRKKYNRTGFPNVKKKKRKIIGDACASEELKMTANKDLDDRSDQLCDRVPHDGETSDKFLHRNKVPRLSVVSLERLQGPSKKNNNYELKSDSTNTTNTRRKSSATKSNASKINSIKKRSQSSSRQFDKQIEIKNIKTASIIKSKTKEKQKPKSIRSARKNTRIKTADSKTENSLENLPIVECKVRVQRQGFEKFDNNLKCNSVPKNNNAKKIKSVKKESRLESKLINKINKIVKCSDHDELEQDPLPDNEGPIDSESTVSDTSSERTSSGRRKLTKSYLSAGLLSDSFKQPIVRLKKSGQGKENNTSLTTSTDMVSWSPQNLLPPPPYCEKFFRKSTIDFMLPYDIWWAYTNSKLPSRSTVPSWNYKKIRTNIYADAVKPNTAGLDHPTCNCKSDVGCGDDCLNRMVYTECSPSTCPNREICRNQKIQRHDVAPGVERFMTENKGWGVRTKLPIAKGTYILEYVGEVVTEKEFKERMASMYANDTHHYCLHLDGGLVIDGHRMGSDGRFVNHSCSPNCEMQKWSVNGLSRMALFAGRNIEPGEEITYDYNFALFNPSEGQPCRCDTPHCRGVIGGKSQRIKPIDFKSSEPNTSVRNGRQRKRQAKKNTNRLHSKDIVLPQLQPLSDREKKIIKLKKCFLLRNLNKVRKQKTKDNIPKDELYGRPLTPNSLAVQISALRVPRNIKTRGLTQASHDPEVEKMAKIAVILREICSSLESIKDDKSEKSLMNKLFVSKKKRLTTSSDKQQSKTIDFPTIQNNIEQGFYKGPEAFDNDMKKMFFETEKRFEENEEKLEIIRTLSKIYVDKKNELSNKLLDLVDEKCLRNFRAIEHHFTPIIDAANSTEDIIRCICGLYKDEGLMIQCSRCMVWQHTECTKADVNADNYMCEKCEPREVDYEIPLEEFTEDGFRYYMSLLRGNLQIRQGDTVYVLRDIPVKDNDGNVIPAKKHTYDTIGQIDYIECDIFRVERLWKNNEGKRFIFGHHYLRPHETFHEPSRRFYPNEVVRVPLYEVVPIELVIARCWVLDRTTFCKGRPIDCSKEEHVYICELRVDKSARFFSKAKQSYPTCTKNYAFRKFIEKLKISKSYAPHDVDLSSNKTKKRKLDESQMATTSSNCLSKRSPSTSSTSSTLLQLPSIPKTTNDKRSRLEDVLKNMKIMKNHNTQINMPALDLSYLLSGRGARKRKAKASTKTVSI